MKKLFVLILLYIFTSNLYCQTSGKMFKKMPVDTFVVDIFTDIWRNKPDGFKNKLINPGVNIYAMGHIPFGKSKFKLTYGLGISIENLYPKLLLKKDSNNVSYFSHVPDNISYKKSKLNLVYADIPIELHFNSGKDGEPGFNFTIGAKIGMLLDAHTKYKGTNMTTSSGQVKTKERPVSNLEKIRYGITARVGYGKFYLFGFYSITPLFKKNNGPDMYPISVGLSFIP